MAVPITFAAGQWLNASDLNDLVSMLGGETGASNPAVTSGNDTTTSASYVSLAGTGSVTSFSFTKVWASTRVELSIAAGWSPTTSSAGVTFGMRIDSTDYDCVKDVKGTGVVGTPSGFAVVTGLAAGTYTVQARWKRHTGTGTLNRDTNHWLAILAKEIN